MRKILRHIYVLACSLFWNNGARLSSPVRFFRKYWAQLILSSVVIQAIACAYGTDDEEMYGDYSGTCRPEFDVEKFSNEAYTECEQQIVEQALIARDIQDNFNKREDATIEAWNETLRKIDEIAVTCEMEHLEEEGSLSGYVCGDGTTETVEEHKARH